jgi:hypothetical protein
MWEYFANDQLGDCTCAAIAHMLMLVTAHTGTMVVPTLDDVITAYSAVSGYDPKTGLNDNGADIPTVLEYWRVTGIAGHKILGWGNVNAANLDDVKRAIWIFGGVDVGIEVYETDMQQFNSGQPWSLTPQDGALLGRHSVPHFGYGHEGTNCISWAQRQGMIWNWFLKRVVECYAVITQDWLNQATKLTPSGFDLAALEADLPKLVA